MRRASTFPAARAAAVLFAAAQGAAVAAAGGDDAREAAAEAARGRALLAQYQCGACHTIPGVAGARGTRGPSLDDIGRRSYLAGRVPNRGALLAQWIADPRSLVPDTPMPDLGVPPAAARAMAAYLATLR